MIGSDVVKAQSPLDEARDRVYGAMGLLSEEQQNEVICSVTVGGMVSWGLDTDNLSKW